MELIGTAQYYAHPKRLYWGQLTNSDAALYTAPSGGTQGPAPKVRITEILLCNTDTSARTVTMEIRTGASAATTRILSAYSIAASTTTILVMDTVLEAAEIISGLADTTAKVNVRISGVELLTIITA